MNTVPSINLAIIMLSISFSSIAHILLKKGMMELATTITTNQSLIQKIISLGINPWVVSGITLHVGALFVWLWALSRVDISFAYPFLALGYVLVSAMAWHWLGEELNTQRLIAMGIIISGIVVLAKAG